MLHEINDVLHEIGGSLDPEARLATVRIDVGRVEIILLEADPEWAEESLAKLDGCVRLEAVIGYRAPEAS